MSSDVEDQAIPEVHRPIGPLCGGYYWFPSPGPSSGGVRWELLTCEDLGYASDDDHFELWLTVIDRLATTWGKKAPALRRSLKTNYCGLPRERLTRPDRYLVLHGDDAPIADWLIIVIRRFRLEGSPHQVLFDEHGRMLPGDSRTVERALKISVGESSRGRFGSKG